MVLGKLELNWKQVKAVKSGQQTNTRIEKMKRQVLIYAQYQQACAQVRIQTLLTAGKLWDDEDFESMKVDEYYSLVEDTLALAVTQVRILRLWRERWEKKKETRFWRQG
jgi:hypothetical protein